MSKTDIKEFVNEALSCIANNFNSNFNEYCNLASVYPDLFTMVDNQKISLQTMHLQDYLGRLYEANIPINFRKDFGQFYTRKNDIIDLMVADLDLLSGKILEPSCGTGLFLVSIIHKIVNLLRKKGVSAEEIILYVVNNIHGNDNDENALIITEINILAELLPIIVEARKTNSSFSMPRLKLTNYDFTQKNIFSKEYAIIIGNPPYVTMYGKHSRNMTENRRKYFNTFDFVQNKQGNNKFNISMFFIENALKTLKEGGRLLFILDISFLETAFIDMRKYIVENYKINRMFYSLQAFDNVASGQIIIDISNNYKMNNVVSLLDYSNGSSKKVAQHEWDNKNNKYKYFVPLDSIADEINKKMHHYNTLDVLFPNKALRTCCALTGKTDEFIVDPGKDSDDLLLPYIEGSKGLKDKFFKPTPNRYIKYDYDLQIKLSDEFKKELALLGVKNKKRVTLGDKDAYLSPKLFIRQSATEIISTFYEEPCAANNSIYVLTNKKKDRESIELLKYTCGILNSELTTFYCRINKIIRAEKGKTPQIKISDLKDVRIYYNDKYFKSIVDIVEELLIDPLNAELHIKLNNLVYKLYSISRQEILYIKNYLLQ